MQPSKRLGLWCGGTKKKKKKRKSLATIDKVRLQPYSISLILITIYFKNLTIRMHTLYLDIIYYMIHKIIFYT